MIRKAPVVMQIKMGLKYPVGGDVQIVREVTAKMATVFQRQIWMLLSQMISP